jgi:hypothetical protein
MATILLGGGVTALALIESAMTKLNMLAAGETLSAEDANVGLLRLNALVDALENEGMFAYTTQDTTFTLAAGDVSMTIGPAQEIPMTRPVRILRGSFSRLDGTDYPLKAITEPEYNEISQKSAASSTVPVVCYYDGGTPTGILYFWPSPSTNVEVHLITPESGGQATDLTTVYTFPPGYQRYLEYALALELAPDFNTVPSQMIIGAAANAKRLLKRTNARVPQMDLDPMFSVYQSDIYSG